MSRADREAWWTLLEADLQTQRVTLITLRSDKAAGEVTDFRLRCNQCGTLWTFKIGVGGVLPPNCRVCPKNCNADVAQD
jgi:hypothetical protein